MYWSSCGVQQQINVKGMVARDRVELYSGTDSIQVIDSKNAYNTVNSMIVQIDSTLAVHGNISNSLGPSPGRTWHAGRKYFGER